MSRVLPILIAAAILAAAATAQSNPCEGITNCEQCVSHDLCGWCSTDVIYKDGQKGGQCAGFQQGVSPPFQCNGIFSTEQCFAGYVCDETDFTCKLGAPGQGNTLQKCEENCTNNGQVYLCNHTSMKCYEVPRGTPGSSSLAVCQASCAHPSPHPAPPTSPKPQSLYACNTTTGTCEEAPAGKGESKTVCEQQCKKVNPDDQYICDMATKSCMKLPPGVPGGESLAQCEAECNPTPAPGPPPQLLGFYRGVQMQNNYVVGTYNFVVNETIVTYVQLQGGIVKSSWTGTPAHYSNAATQQMAVTLTSGPDSGKVVQVLGVVGAPGPETKRVTMAFSAAGGTMPTSIESAMSGNAGQQVYAFSSCLSQDCVFTLPALAMNRVHRHRHMHRLSADTPTDRCSAFAANCSYCLSNEYCGWCSVPVEYKDGSKGTQCAGFNSANGSSPAFKCNGRYSTFNCTEGYMCDHSDNTCKVTTPGNGMPLTECEQFCHATPPPTPSQPFALCNLTTKQCHPCPNNQTNCPGALPLGACEAECSSHKKGPPTATIGVWRGIYIENGYKRVEVDVVFNNETATFVQAGEEPMTCNVTSLGSDLMIFNIINGTYKGWTFAALYQSVSQPNGAYTTMTMAAGKLGSNAPSTFNGAMGTQGDLVYEINKCGAAPCSFQNPLGPAPPQQQKRQ